MSNFILPSTSIAGLLPPAERVFYVYPDGSIASRPSAKEVGEECSVEDTRVSPGGKLVSDEISDHWARFESSALTEWACCPIGQPVQYGPMPQNKGVGFGTPASNPHTNPAVKRVQRRRLRNKIASISRKVNRTTHKSRAVAASTTRKVWVQDLIRNTEDRHLRAKKLGESFYQKYLRTEFLFGRERADATLSEEERMTEVRKSNGGQCWTYNPLPGAIYHGTPKLREHKPRPILKAEQNISQTAWSGNSMPRQYGAQARIDEKYLSSSRPKPTAKSKGITKPKPNLRSERVLERPLTPQDKQAQAAKKPKPVLVIGKKKGARNSRFKEVFVAFKVGDTAFYRCDAEEVEALYRSALVQRVEVLNQSK